MPIPRSSIRVAVVAALEEIVGVPAHRIADGDHLVEQLGLDSLNAASCVVAIEQRLEARIPAGRETELVDVKTVGELIDRLEEVFDREDDESASR